MTTSKKQLEYNKDYEQKNYKVFRVRFRINPPYDEVMKAFEDAVSDLNVSQNTFIVDAVREKLGRLGYLHDVLP